MDPSPTCSAISLAVGEPLLGTAPTASEWLLVEHVASWEHDATASLPEPARSAVAGWVKAGNRRVQLIRRPSRRLSGDGHLVAVADLARGTIVGTRVASLEAVNVPEGGEPVTGPLVLVCVHGRRDRCCAEHGRAVVDALTREMPGQLWESSHLGGHRFAATAALLPSGRVLGRLSPATAAHAIRRALDGEPTGHDRGQAGLSEPDQVRAMTGSAVPSGALLRPASCGAQPTIVRPWVPDPAATGEVMGGDGAVLAEELDRAREAGAAGRKVILVEGVSDKRAIEALASRLGRDLDDEAIVVIPIAGATNLTRFLDLLGPSGHDVPLSGLCDEGEAVLFQEALAQAGLGTSLEAQGFHVCRADLEDELIRALGPNRMLELMASQGDQRGFRSFQVQPAQRSKTIEEQLVRWLGNHKIRYAPLMVAALDLYAVPAPLRGVLDRWDR
ncbi:MAG TPA: sucrase ferredoxin [Nitriliruptorales bacterium]